MPQLIGITSICRLHRWGIIIPWLLTMEACLEFGVRGFIRAA